MASMWLISIWIFSTLLRSCTTIANGPVLECFLDNLLGHCLELSYACTCGVTDRAVSWLFCAMLSQARTVLSLTVIEDSCMEFIHNLNFG